MFSHIMVGSNDIDRSQRFYDALFGAVGGQPGRKDAKGRLVGVSKIARDITARKRAEAALREGEALKTGILNAGSDAIITTNQATEVLEFNAAAERIFGYARKEAIGKRVADLIVPPSQRKAHTRGVARYPVRRSPKSPARHAGCGACALRGPGARRRAAFSPEREHRRRARHGRHRLRSDAADGQAAASSAVAG